MAKISENLMIRINELLLGIDSASEFWATGASHNTSFCQNGTQRPVLLIADVGDKLEGPQGQKEIIQSIAPAFVQAGAPLAWADNNPYNGLSGPLNGYPSQPLLILNAANDDDVRKILPILERDAALFQGLIRDIILATPADFIVGRLNPDEFPSFADTKSTIAEYRSRDDISETDWGQLFSRPEYQAWERLEATLLDQGTVTQLIDHMQDPPAGHEVEYQILRDQIIRAWPLLSPSFKNCARPNICADTKTSAPDSTPVMK